jgi:hypothetical protein
MNLVWCADGTCNIREIGNFNNSPVNVEQHNVMQQHSTMYPVNQSVIYHNLQEALHSGFMSIRKVDNSCFIHVPDKRYTVLWLKVSNDSLQTITVSSGGKSKEMHIGTSRTSSYSPDGLSNFFENENNLWIPIPIHESCMIYGTDVVPLIKSIAFSTNPWNHAMISTNDAKGFKTQKGELHIQVPFINSGRNKILYILASRNSDLYKIANIKLRVNGIPITGSFHTCFDNPFSKELQNSQLQYVGIVIPESIVKLHSSQTQTQTHMQMQIHDDMNVIMTPFDPTYSALAFIEIGTHDEYNDIPPHKF